MLGIMTKRMMYYGVVTKDFKGVVNSWPECRKWVIGVSEARFKKFGTRDQAEKFIASNGDWKTPHDDYDEEAAGMAEWLKTY